MILTRILLITALLFISAPTLAQEKAVDVPAEGSWAVRCNESDAGENDAKDKVNCEMFQILAIKETGKRYAEFAIGFPKDKDTARGVIILPLGILLQPGVRLKIDDQKAFQFSVRFCRNDGCYAVVTLTQDILENMKKGENAIIAFATLEGKGAALNFSLKGFNEAFKEIN